MVMCGSSGDVVVVVTYSSGDDVVVMFGVVVMCSGDVVVMCGDDVPLRSLRLPLDPRPLICSLRAALWLLGPSDSEPWW